MEIIDKIAIECIDVSKSFFNNNQEENEVLRNISLTIIENEFVVLLGPGQCGKTTLVKMIAGLEPIEHGEIKVFGEKVVQPGPNKGLVYQSTAIFPWMTTMGNVEYGPKMRGVPKEERRARAQHYINLVGLDGFEDAYPSQLSGGMKQRVGIARVYCNDPDILLMHGPFSALDAQTRYLMQEEIANIWSKEKKTILFITNNVEEAVYLADRIIVLSNTPTIIKQEFVIDLPRPREYTDPKFLKIRKMVSEAVDTTR